MAWRNVLLLTALAGCELPALPKTVHADSAFSARELAVIESAVAETNDLLLRPCLGENGLHYAGALDVPRFDEMGDAYGDGRHVIYKVYRDETAYETLSCLAGRDFGGHATLQDVILTVKLDAVPGLEEEIAAIEAMPGWEEDEDLKEEHDALVALKEAIEYRFRRVFLHELGHHVGLTHHPDPGTLMHAGHEKAATFTDGDRRAFSLARGCDYP